MGSKGSAFLKHSLLYFGGLGMKEMFCVENTLNVDAFIRTGGVCRRLLGKVYTVSQ